jgi:hypothetical protein
MRVQAQVAFARFGFGAKGKGKRGGARVIYYWYSDDAPISPFWRMARTKRRI